MKAHKLINFTELLKKTWDCVWKFKFLWLLGLLAGGGVNVSGNNFSYFFNSDSDTQKWENLKTSSAFEKMPEVGKVLGATDTAWPVAIIVLVIVLALVLCAVMIYLRVTARGAIIVAVDQIDKDQATGLGESWHRGHKYFWNIFVYSLLVGLVILLPLIFLGTPIAIMVAVKWYIPAAIFGFLFFIVFLLYTVYISLAVLYGERILVLENRGAWDSIKLGLSFFHTNWQNVLLVYLISIVVGIAAATAILFGVLLVGGAFFGVVLALYYLNVTVAIVAAIPLTLALLVAMITAGGMVASYQSALATLSYKEIKSIA